MDVFPPLPEIDEPLSESAAGVLLALALATIRFDGEQLGADVAPDRTRAGV